MKIWRAKASRVALAVLFMAMGILHFAVPAPFARIIPPFLPAPALLVAVSGVFEFLGGLGVLISPTRRFAGYGLIALLLAVWPANFQMAHLQWRANGWTLYHVRPAPAPAPANSADSLGSRRCRKPPCNQSRPQSIPVETQANFRCRFVSARRFRRQRNRIKKFNFSLTNS